MYLKNKLLAKIQEAHSLKFETILKVDRILSDVKRSDGVAAIKRHHLFDLVIWSILTVKWKELGNYSLIGRLYTFPQEAENHAKLSYQERGFEIITNEVIDLFGKIDFIAINDRRVICVQVKTSMVGNENYWDNFNKKSSEEFESIKHKFKVIDGKEYEDISYSLMVFPIKKI